MTTAKRSDLFFIDRNNYINLQSKKINLDTIGKLVKGEEDNDSFSDLTKIFIIELNRKLNYSFFTRGTWNTLVDCMLIRGISKLDSKYIQDSCNAILTKEDAPGDIPLSVLTSSGHLCHTQGPKKYYEIIPMSDTYADDLLVVVEDGFFDAVTKTKESLLSFYLDCLGVQYKFNSDLEFLLKNYINLRINEGAFDLVKLRFN